MPNPQNNQRYVKLTETGLGRLNSARRKYRSTVEDIVVDVSTPSVNTIKRALRQEPVFVSTLERIWEYFQRCAEENRERLPFLIEGEDYHFTDNVSVSEKKERATPKEPEASRVARGWISQQVPRPNRLFMGRRDVLDRLHTSLTNSANGHAALVADPQALTGLGGIGKTQTAIAYIYEHWRDYDHLFWVSADTIESIQDGLANLAEELGLLAATPSTKRQALETMHDWFRRETGWLLVLDNADDIEQLAPHFPRHHSGRLIITTRARNTVKWADRISLSQFGREEGALFLLRRAGLVGVSQLLADAPEDVQSAAVALGEELDGLPLALDQAGAYLADSTATVSDYHDLYRRHGLRFLDSTANTEHASVSITYTLAVEQMSSRSSFGPAAVEMVRLCAFLMPDAIPEAIFLSFPFRSTNTPNLDNAEQYDAVCAAACAYSLVTRNPQNRSISVHRLVQKVTRDSLSEEETRMWAERAVEAVADATPDFEFEDWSLCEMLLPQWRFCRDYVEQYHIQTTRAAYLLYQAGRYLRARALYDEAESYIRMAVSIAEQVHGACHRITADYLDDLACLYRVLDRRTDAERLHTRAVETMEQVEGRDHVFVASKLHNMALLYVHYEEYALAEGLFVRALDIHEKQEKPNRHLIATTLTQLAGVYRNEGRYDKAEPCCIRALETYESLLDPYHIDIATGCNNLGLLYLTMDRLSDSEAMYERALRINERSRGEGHPETGTVLWGLARVRWKQGRMAEAEPLFQRAINIFTRHFGKDHTRSARVLKSYAEFQQDKQGRTV